VNRPYGKPGLLWLALGGAVWLACMSEASDVPAGRIEVVVTLTGAVAEPTDLALILDQRFRVALSGSGSAVFERVKGGPHRVTLVGVDARCGVRPGLERELVIAESDTIQVEFEITCSATSGLLQLVTTITGSDHDPDGYTLLVDGEPRSRMEPSGVHQLTLPEGPHRLTLSGLSGSCRLPRVGTRRSRSRSNAALFLEPARVGRSRSLAIGQPIVCIQMRSTS
jgi:hypothetical protein